MSGTSLDGVDVAMLRTDGRQIVEVGPSAFRAYTTTEKSHLRAALGQWPGGDYVSAAADIVLKAHVEALQKLPIPDLIGFHGQTLAHDPGGDGTHQVGDGAALAAAMGVPVVWDFRSDDVAMGGQGAPLAPAYHHAILRYAGVTEPCAVLNLGGVGNITWVDPISDETAMIAFDTGPANAPLNDLMQRRRGAAFDEGGALAAQGKADEGIIAGILARSFFAAPPPKSLDRDDFADVLMQVADLPDADAAATLTALMAACVDQALSHLPAKPAQIIVSGGGRRNPVVMAEISRRCQVDAVPIDRLGLNGDMIEAQAFAYLAARVRAGLPTSYPMTTGVPMAVGGGVFSRI